MGMLVTIFIASMLLVAVALGVGLQSAALHRISTAAWRCVALRSYKINGQWRQSSTEERAYELTAASSSNGTLRQNPVQLALR